MQARSERGSRASRLLAVGAAAVLLIGVATVTLFQVWPLPARLSQSDYATILLDRNGQLLNAQIAADEQWRFAPVESLPPKYEQALLTFEDSRFYYHPGVDPLAIARALVDAVRHGGISSGASTLTMQLARMLADRPPRTLGNKAREALRALQLEWHFSKRDLLIHYSSHAPFGGNIVGLRAAAWRYFGRAPDDLSWAEAALLAVLPKNPAAMHPGRGRSLLQARRDHLLRRLAKAGLVTPTELELALLEPVPARPDALPRLAPHLLASLRSRSPQTFIFRSTIDWRMQSAANRVARHHQQRLARQGVHNVAAVILNHETMETLAYIGNQTGIDEAEHAPAVDIVQSPRSTGSLLKPLLYGLMLQEGELLPTTLIADTPAYFGGYQPRNHDYSYRGAVPAQQALSSSLNVPAVHMLRQFGIGRFQHHLQAMGLTTLFRPAEDYGLSLILGGAEGTLWDMTNAYAKLTATARDGSQVRGSWQAQRLQDHGRIPAPADKSLDFPIGQGAAWLTLQAMIEVTRPGLDNLWRSFSDRQTIAWKTGTSYGLRDGWAIGSNGRFTVGVWTGNADGSAAPSLSGQGSAAPILFALMEQVGHADWLELPLAALKKVRVCRDDGFFTDGKCPTIEVLAPRNSHFQQVSPHYRLVHTDAAGRYRVHGGCESSQHMRSAHYFVLPAAQAFFWRQHHSHYQLLPPWRADCVADLPMYAGEQPMELIYPQPDSEIFIPVGLDGQRSRMVLRAVHRNPDSVIHWYVGKTYLGHTRTFHEQAISLEPGRQTLILVDAEGYQLQQSFEVLGDRNSL